jgi:hypothetical protein
LAELAFGLPDEDEVQAGLQGDAGGEGGVFDDADGADGGRGQDRPAFGFVIEGDIAGDDGKVEGQVTRAANWPMISCLSGLPKFMLSVTASGVAPVAVRLRQASATACAPPASGSAAQ